MIEVRRAQVEDLPPCLDMTGRFHAASPIAKIAPFDKDGMAATLRAMFQNDHSGVGLALRDGQPVGIAGALLYPSNIFAGVQKALPMRVLSLRVYSSQSV